MDLIRLNQSQEIDEPIYSEKKKNDIKVKEFKEYLVKKDIVLAMVKCN